MLLPNTTAHAISKPIQPFVLITSTMANVAADDCMTMVIAMPTNTNSSTEAKPLLEYWARNSRVLASSSGTLALIMPKPMNRNEKPMMNSPIDLYRLFFEKRRMIDKPINGTAKALMLTLTPKIEIIHAVNVVPTLAPIITAIDCCSDINPALTKLTTITVEADEL